MAQKIMEREIKGIIFDLGGVIIEGGDVNLIYQCASQELGVPVGRIEEAISNDNKNFPINLGKETSVQFWQRMCKKLGVRCPDDEVLQSLWSRTYDQLEINEDVLRLIDKLRSDYAVGMISNTIKEHADINRERKVFDHFDDVVLSNEVGLRKPGREIYELASKRLDIPSDKLLFIDDKVEHVDAARDCGMHAILFESSEQLEDDLIKLGIL